MGIEAKDGESSQKAETWRTGPVEVKKRVGDSSYEAELHPGELHAVHAVHADRLKPFVRGDPVELFHFEAGYAQEGLAPQEWNVETILGHRWVAGKPQFLTKWEARHRERRRGSRWATFSTGIPTNSRSIAGERGSGWTWRSISAEDRWR